MQKIWALRKSDLDAHVLSLDTETTGFAGGCLANKKAEAQKGFCLF